jgi:hypothetical protein
VGQGWPAAMVCLSLTIHLRRLGAVVLGCRRRAAWLWSRMRPGRSSATRRHRRPDGTPAAQRALHVPSETDASGQPWHLPYRPTVLPKLAVLQVGDWPCRARPADRSWSRRTGAPKASATRRDRNPRCSQDCSRDRPRHPGMSGYRTRRRFGIQPAQRPGRGQERTGHDTTQAI